MSKRRTRTTRRRRPVRRARRNPTRRRAAPMRRRRSAPRRAPKRAVRRRRARRNPSVFANPTVMTVLWVGGGFLAGKFFDDSEMGRKFSSQIKEASSYQITGSTAIGSVLIGVGLWSKMGDAKIRRQAVAFGAGMILTPVAGFLTSQATEMGWGERTSGARQPPVAARKRLPPPRTSSRSFIRASQAISSTDYA